MQTLLVFFGHAPYSFGRRTSSKAKNMRVPHLGGGEQQLNKRLLIGDKAPLVNEGEHLLLRSIAGALHLLLLKAKVGDCHILAEKVVIVKAVLEAD